MESKLEKNKKFLGSVVNKTPNGNQSKAFHGMVGRTIKKFLPFLDNNKQSYESPAQILCLFPCQKRMVSQQTKPHKLSLQ